MEKITTYGKGFALKVTPEERGPDVLHYLITGHLLGGRSLEGVEWEEVNDQEHAKLVEKRTKALAMSMRTHGAAVFNNSLTGNEDK